MMVHYYRDTKRNVLKSIEVRKVNSKKVSADNHEIKNPLSNMAASARYPYDTII